MDEWRFLRARVRWATRPRAGNRRPRLGPDTEYGTLVGGRRSMKRRTRAVICPRIRAAIAEAPPARGMANGQSRRRGGDGTPDEGNFPREVVHRSPRTSGGKLRPRIDPDAGFGRPRDAGSTVLPGFRAAYEAARTGRGAGLGENADGSGKTKLLMKGTLTVVMSNLRCGRSEGSPRRGLMRKPVAGGSAVRGPRHVRGSARQSPRGGPRVERGYGTTPPRAGRRSAG